MLWARLGSKFHPRYLPVVFTSLENTPKVANTSKYWSVELSHLEIITQSLLKLMLIKIIELKMF